MWEIDNNQLYKDFSFKNFREAFKFMEAVAELAEQQQHHPKWQNEWNKVGIWLSTHEAGDTITNKDHHLAETIDAAYNRLIQTKFVEQNTTLSPAEIGKDIEIKLYADGGSRVILVLLRPVLSY